MTRRQQHNHQIETTPIFIDSKQRTLFAIIKEAYIQKALLWNFIIREIKAKYANTYLGVGWLMLDPVLNIFILFFVFGVLSKSTDLNGSPLMFILVGMCIWTLYSTLISQAGNSFQSFRELIKKIYFPRIYIPLTKGVFGMIQCAVILLALILILVFTQSFELVNLFYSLFYLFLAFAGAFGLGLIASGLQLQFYDIHYILPFLVRLGLFLSPIAYAVDQIPANYQVLYFINPAAGAIQGFRMALSGTEVEISALISALSNLIWLFLGFNYFRKVEHVISEQ